MIGGCRALSTHAGEVGFGEPFVYGFSCITVTTVMQENLLCEPHAVLGRVACIMGAPNHNARNFIGSGQARSRNSETPQVDSAPSFDPPQSHGPVLAAAGQGLAVGGHRDR